jgi:hypothetical protein
LRSESDQTQKKNDGPGRCGGGFLYLVFQIFCFPAMTFYFKISRLVVAITARWHTPVSRAGARLSRAHENSFMVRNGKNPWRF